MKLQDLSILEFGNTLKLSAAVFASNNIAYICWFPDQSRPARVLEEMELDETDWIQLLRQTDLVEVQGVAKNEHGDLVKAIMRKTQRQIDKHVSWGVFKRDAYRCRYCGVDGVPLTVDHLVLWEEGGPSIPENLVTACSPCNKARGNLPYEEWLKHPYYAAVSEGIGGSRRGISGVTKDDNERLKLTLDAIPRRYRSSKKRK